LFLFLVGWGGISSCFVVVAFVWVFLMDGMKVAEDVMESTVFAQDSFTNEAPVAVAKPVGLARRNGDLRWAPVTTRSHLG